MSPWLATPVSSSIADQPPSPSSVRRISRPVLIPYGSGQLGISVLSLRLGKILLVEVAREEPGPSGAGKTTLTEHVCQQLERQTLAVRIGYVNCLSANTATGVLHTLLRDARIGRDLPRESTPRTRYFDRIRESEAQFVFVLDSYAALGSLYDHQNVTLLTICVDEDAFLSKYDTAPTEDRTDSLIWMGEVCALDPHNRRASSISEVSKKTEKDEIPWMRNFCLDSLTLESSVEDQR